MPEVRTFPRRSRLSGNFAMPAVSGAVLSRADASTLQSNIAEKNYLLGSLPQTEFSLQSLDASIGSFKTATRLHAHANGVYNMKDVCRYS